MAAGCAVVHRTELLRFSVYLTSRKCCLAVCCKMNVVVATESLTVLLYVAMTTCPMVQASYTPRFGLYASYTTSGLRPSVV